MSAPPGTYLDVFDVLEAYSLHAELPVIFRAACERHNRHERLDMRAQAGGLRRLHSRVNESVPVLTSRASITETISRTAIHNKEAVSSVYIHVIIS